NFACWQINGIAEQPRQTDIQFRVEADTAVEAVYNILGDANGDCVVNVLDLIAIRNRLGSSSADSWRGDVNLDGSVDVLDLISTRNKLGTRCQ
ncbi:MAG TPA: dockerin type I domain-containing protein, partial [Phycisphaerae bacterium]|nr:dockerin type I domain-containing protein [Phycisphaerae bacterium]